MNYTIKTEFLPRKEFLVIKNYAKIYDDLTSNENEVWNIINENIKNGLVDRLKKTTGSDRVFMLFCNTCARNDNEKCYVCSYDIACENYNFTKANKDFNIIILNPCEYVIFDCKFDNEISLPNAHQKSDGIFWQEWLKQNSYTCAIDDQKNWIGNGFASIEEYLPFNSDVTKFNAKIWYPIIKKFDLVDMQP